MNEAAPPTMTQAKLRALLEVRTRVGFSVKGESDGWLLVVHAGRRKTVLSTARGTPRRFRRFEPLVAYLKALGIFKFEIDSTDFTPGVRNDREPDRRSLAASERMRRAHRAVAGTLDLQRDMGSGTKA